MDVRELEVRLKADISQLQSALGQIQGSSAQAASSFGTLAASFAVGQQAVRLFGEAMDAAKGLLSSAIDEAKKGQYDVAQLTSALESTGRGGASAVKNMTDFADSLEKTNAVSHLTIESVESLLLSYTNLTEAGIKQATQASLDLAARFGIDAQAAALKLGEALQNPETGMTRLAAVGVKLSASQTQLVKDFMAVGDTAKAQEVILNAVAAISGGAASANARTLGGEMAELGIQVDDAKESLGNLLGNALRPMIQGITAFVSNNQQFVISLMAGVVAGAIFAGTLISVAVAAVILWSALGPLTILLVALGALVGVGVFGAFQQLQTQMAATTNGVKEGSLAMGNAAQDGMGQAAQAAQDLADKLAKVDEQMSLSNKHFTESLAEIIHKHQDSASTLKSQLDQENSDYQDAMDQKRQSFEDSQVRIDQSHQKTLDKLNTEMQQYVGNGRQVDSIRLADVQQRIDEENASYDDQSKTLKDQYAKDAANAAAAHQKKLDDLQTKLNDEDNFLTKHAADVASIQGVQLNDEIDKLKETHAEEMKSYDEQKTAIIKSAQQAAGGVIGAYGGIPAGLKGLQGPMANVGNDLGNSLAEALKRAFINSMQDVALRIVNFYANAAATILSAGQLKGNSGADAFSWIAGHLPRFAKGGSITEPSMVGEQGPEVYVPFAAGTIVPNHKLGNNQTVSIHMNIGTVNGINDVQSIGDTLARQLQVAARGF